MDSTTAITLPSLRTVKWSTCFKLIIGGFLAFNGFAGLFAGLEGSRVPDLPDPIFGISIHSIVLGLSTVELLVAAICLFARQGTLVLGLAVWLASVSITYRIGAWTMSWHHPYAWVSGIMNSLNVSSLAADIFSMGTIMFVFVAGAAILCCECRKHGAAGSFKMSCPSCGVHIRFAVQNLSQNITCPKCRGAVTLRRPEESLKISCYFCKGHIEFPPHAVGEKLKCPHCQMDITLKEPATT